MFALGVSEKRTGQSEAHHIVSHKKSYTPTLRGSLNLEILNYFKYLNSLAAYKKNASTKNIWKMHKLDTYYQSDEFIEEHDCYF